MKDLTAEVLALRKEQAAAKASAASNGPSYAAIAQRKSAATQVTEKDLKVPDLQFQQPIIGHPDQFLAVPKPAIGLQAPC